MPLLPKGKLLTFYTIAYILIPTLTKDNALLKRETKEDGGSEYVRKRGSEENEKMEGREVESVGVGSPNLLGEHLLFAPEKRYVYRTDDISLPLKPQRGDMCYGKRET